MRVLFDTNVLLGVILGRYLVERARTRHVALSAVRDLLSIVDVAAVGREDMHRALTLGLKDFEDAVQVAAALGVGADYLVTRDTKHFRTAPIEIRTPGEVLALCGTRWSRGGG